MNGSPPPTIGKIVKSNTHVDYVCQVFAAGEADATPAAHDFGFGTFVTISLDGGPAGAAGSLVGVIYNTLLMNPEFGNLGPRLSPRPELEVFTPDYLQETATLVGIIAVGWLDAAGEPHQGVPRVAATVGAAVHQLEQETLRAFHAHPTSGVRLGYAALLLGQNSPLVPHLLIQIVDTLSDLFPNAQGPLQLMRDNLAWKSIVAPSA